MRPLVRRSVRRLFLAVVLPMAAAGLISALCTGLGAEGAPLWILLSAAGALSVAAAALYRYVRAQSGLLEDAAAQIRAFLSGRRDARIACDDEGDLYCLFQEVNTLAAVLSAHAEQEGRARGFMRDTLSDISHQLKTPLAALNIYHGIVRQEAGDIPAVREFMDRSDRELDRMEALVQNLLKIARLDAGTVVLERAVEEVPEMMADVARRFACRAEREGKSLTLSGGDGVTLLCDRGWLTEAVGNLVKNALDHTARGDSVRLEWRALPWAVRIAVRDSGSGIHPEDLPHIFKRFYRSRFAQDTQGVGLGLPLAKAVVEAHSGTLEVESAPGSGAVFTATFLIPTKL